MSASLFSKRPYTEPTDTFALRLTSVIVKPS